MRKIGTISVVVVSGLAIATAFGRTAAAIPTDTIGLVRAVEAGDDNGGHGRGKDDLVVAVPTASPSSQSTEVEPGDDKGGATEAEPGDDNGGSDDSGGHGGHGSDD